MGSGRLRDYRWRPGTNPGVEAGMVETTGKEVGNPKDGGAGTTTGGDCPTGISKGGYSLLIIMEYIRFRESV